MRREKRLEQKGKAEMRRGREDGNAEEKRKKE